MLFCSAHYTKLADMLHERERDIKAARGRIIDSTGSILADNRTVCTISVIHSQIEDAETVIEVLSRELGLSQEYVRKRVEKYTAREKIKSNVDKEIGDKIRNLDMAGVKVDEDYKRYYPYGELASKVLGFTGADNQGIVGLEVKYEKYLTGQNGQILTITDAKGIELDGMGEKRKEPIAGSDLYVSLDVNIQKYAMPQSRVYVQVQEYGMAPERFVEITIKNMSATELNFDPEEITERFVRGDTSRGTEGSGLGLAIARSFTEAQGGKLTIEVDGDLFKVVIRLKCGTLQVEKEMEV